MAAGGTSITVILLKEKNERKEKTTNDRGSKRNQRDLQVHQRQGVPSCGNLRVPEAPN